MSHEHDLSRVFVCSEIRQFFLFLLEFLLELVFIRLNTYIFLNQKCRKKSFASLESQFSKKETSIMIPIVSDNRPIHVYFVFEWQLSSSVFLFARPRLSIHLRSIPSSLWTEFSINFAHTIPFLVYPICFVIASNY